MGLTRPRPFARTSSIVPHYQTFPTAPPRSKGRPPSQPPPNPNQRPSRTDSKGSGQQQQQQQHRASPLPIKQLAVLAFVCLCEQTALNSISPYLPQMASTFPEVDIKDVGVYVGTIASVFAAAQFATNFFWGWLSDRVGRKPVILLGTFLTAACLFAFGFCRTLWQAIVVQGIMGLINGNQGVVSTCLGEITDRSNQSRAFAYLPVLYGLGAITGPLLGGLAAGSLFPNYPYLAPNLLAAAVLLLDLVVLMLFMEESLEEAQNLPPLGKRIAHLALRAWRSASPRRYIYPRQQKPQNAWTDSPVVEDSTSIAEAEDEGAQRSTSALLMPSASSPLPPKKVFGRETILILFTYFIFQLSNVSYNSLYPIFGSAPAPTGRNLSTEEIGFSLAFAGLIAIVFQVGLFNSLHERLGNRVTYRVSLALFAITFFVTPFVGYKDAAGGTGTASNAKVLLWVELGIVLLVKTVASVGGLTSVLLLVCNSPASLVRLG